MPRSREQIAAAVLFIVPEWVAFDGRCATCRSAMTLSGKATFRCEQHNVPINLDNSCESYGPAPNLVEARQRARTGSGTCEEARS
jgi:hypothetical protein